MKQNYTIKFMLCTLITIVISSSVYAQNPDQALARVHYKFNHIKDTTNRDLIYQEKMLLIIGKNTSLYTSHEKMLQADRLAAFLKQQTKENGGTLTNVVMQKGLIRTVTSVDFYTYAHEQKLFTIEYMAMNKYIIPEDLAPIKWNIQQDTTSFSGISCRKATTHFKGRNWTAWYAVELPFQSGPWKLNGLPGLIVEAYDERKEVYFQFDGLENVNEANLVTKDEKIALGNGEINFSNNFYLGKEIKLPTDAIKATREEITRLRKALADNPQSAINSQTTGLATVQRKSTVSTSQIKNTFNNPIELPEKNN